MGRHYRKDLGLDLGFQVENPTDHAPYPLAGWGIRQIEDLRQSHRLEQRHQYWTMKRQCLTSYLDLDRW